MYRSSQLPRSADRKINALKSSLSSELPESDIGVAAPPPLDQIPDQRIHENVVSKPLKKTITNNDGRDEQIAELFSAMRRVSRLSSDNLATRLQTTPEMIDALECGNLSYLPEWEDIARVVMAYANFVNIDERPILRRLRERLTEHFLSELTNETQTDVRDSYSSELNIKSLAQGRTQSLPPVPKGEIRTYALDGCEMSKDQDANQSLKYRLDNFVSAPPQVNTKVKKSAPQPGPVEETGKKDEPIFTAIIEEPQRSKRFGKVGISAIFSLVFLVVFISWQPNRFWSGVDQLPKPISSSIYSMFTAVLPDPLTSLYKMQWIKVENPRLRKADKLPVPPVRKPAPLDLPSR